VSIDLETFQALLGGMREEFLAELPERCDRAEELILKLERAPTDRDVFNLLYRDIHSLKGAGGTHRLNIITSICHQLENLLADADQRQAFDDAFVSRALGHIDLLRQVEPLARQDTPDFAAIETALDNLRQSQLQSRKAILIAESSIMMTRIYQQALDALPLQLAVVDDGLVALERLLHEPFDGVIVGRELKELNGIAVLVALRATQSRNHDLPAIMISSNPGKVPTYAHVSRIITRDQNMAENLVKALNRMVLT